MAAKRRNVLLVLLGAAGLALVVVEMFRGTNGFGVAGNTCDPVDFAASAVGTGLALALDAATGRIGEHPLRRVRG